VVHSLSIGEPVVKKLVSRGIEKGTLMVPADLETKISPMDGNAYVTFDLHEAYHHYLKVVTTNVEGLKMGKRDLKAYQIIQSSQLSYYRSDIVPEAKVSNRIAIHSRNTTELTHHPFLLACRPQFIFDLSPIAVHYNGRSRHWYDYVTSIMAIIGGTFTVVGMVESTIYQAVSGRKRY
jgi:Endoplasmic reticulum vesicle transporter